MPWDFYLFLVVVVVVGTALVSLELDVAPKNPRVRRIWGWSAYSIAGLFVVWLLVAAVFLRPQG